MLTLQLFPQNIVIMEIIAGVKLKLSLRNYDNLIAAFYILIVKVMVGKVAHEDKKH